MEEAFGWNGTFVYHDRDLVVPPTFRLDVTTAIVRRFARTSGTVEWRDGAFMYALPARGEPVVVAISQPEPERLHVVIRSAESAIASSLTQVATMLGLGYDDRELRLRARHIGWLRDLIERFSGAWPACAPTMWEAAVTALAFQSVSMLAAAAVIDRLVVRFGIRVADRDRTIAVFPTPRAIAAASDAELRTTGLSRAKVDAMRSLAVTIRSPLWDVRELRRLATAELCARLVTARGIGPWSAAVIALRGLGRLDIFPARDSGVIRTIEQLSNRTPDALAAALVALGDKRGMLYHLLLLARLDDRKLLDRTASTPAAIRPTFQP